MSVRRIVTGHDENGKAVVIADGESPNIVRPDNRPGVEINNLWLLKEAPSKPLGEEESVKDVQIGLLPPTNGSVFRVIKFPPEKIGLTKSILKQQKLVSPQLAQKAHPIRTHPRIH